MIPTGMLIAPKKVGILPASQGQSPGSTLNSSHNVAQATHFTAFHKHKFLPSLPVVVVTMRLAVHCPLFDTQSHLHLRLAIPGRLEGFSGAHTPTASASVQAASPRENR